MSDRAALGISVAACVAASAILLVFLAWKTQFTSLFSDSAIYLLLAETFASPPAAFDWQSFLFARYPFPPLYPLMLAAVGASVNVIVWTHLVGAITMSLCAGAMLGWLQRESVPLAVALIATALFMLMPVSVFSATDIYSEPLYVLLTLGALVCLARDPRGGSWYVAALSLGLAAIVRTVGITAVIAFIVHWWFATGGRRYRGAPFLALLPTLGWALFKWSHGYESSYVLTIVRSPLSETVPALLATLPANIDALWQHGLRGLDVLDNPAGGLWVAAPLLLAFIGFGQRLRERRFDALYLGAYFALIVIWPHGEHAGRFLFVVIPIMLFHAIIAALSIALALPVRIAEPLAGAIPVLLLGVLVLPSSAVIIGEVVAHHGGVYTNDVRAEPWYRVPDRTHARESADIVREMTAAISRLGDLVEPEACITSIFPQTVMWLTHRPGLFPAKPSASQAAFELSMRQCPYVMIVNATSDAFGYPAHFYPRERMGTHLDVLETIHYVNVTPAPAVAAILARYRVSQQ